MNKIDTKLSFKEKIGYGLGDTASHFVWDMVGFWILIFTPILLEYPLRQQEQSC